MARKEAIGWDNPFNMDSKRMTFCYEYAACENAEDAAEAAKFRRSKGAELMKDGDVIETISLIQARRAKRLGINIDTVLLEVGKIAFGSVEHIVQDISSKGCITYKEFQNLPKDVVDTIESVKTDKDGYVYIKFHSKLKALEMLMRNLGAFQDNVNLGGGKDPIKVESGLSPAMKETLDGIYDA